MTRSKKKARRTAARPVEVIARDIARSRTLGKATTWVIAGEVHVKAGVTLTVADGATILVSNGVVPRSRLRRAALIFDPGSRLRAGRFAMKAAGPGHRPQRVSDNGGVWFLGTHRAGASDGIAVRTVAGAAPSSFRARAISAEHLGRQDSYRSARTGRRLGIGDDIDGFKLIGVGPDEWQVREVRTRFAADDGFDLTNSSIRMDRLVVRDPTEDGLNLSSSRIEVRRSLELDVGKTRERDRDIIDLEVDDGGSIVELPRGCRVKVRGVFGDQAQLASRDMPRPDTRADYETPYRYDGRLRRDAVVFSLTED